MNDLIIRLTGAVTESNFDQWKEQVLEQIRAANRELKTDEDFSWAEGMVKTYKDAEQAVKKAKDEALAQTADVNKLFAAMDQIAAELAGTRLSLEKQVKLEKERRKADIVADAIATVRTEVETATNGTIFTVADIDINTTVIKAATAGKKTIDGMRKAVNVVAAAEIRRHREAVEGASMNIAEIEKIEADYPGLFPDRKSLAWKSPDEIRAIIDARVSKYRLQVREKEDRAKQQDLFSGQHQVVAQPSQPPSTSQPPSPPLQVPPESGSESAANEVRDFVFTVNLRCTVEEAKAIAANMSQAFGESEKVVSFHLARR